MNFNLTYLTAGIQVLFGAAGWYFGWLDPAIAMGFITTGLAVFGIRTKLSAPDPLGGVSGGKRSWW